MTQNLGVTNFATFNYRTILAGDFDRPKVIVMLAPGSFYVLGSVVTKATSGPAGLCTLWDATSTDIPYAVLSEDVDATAATAPVPGTSWQGGQFVGPRLTFAAGTWQDGELAARNVSLFFLDAALQPNQ